MNVELAHAALEAAKAHRDRFDMMVWHCAAPKVGDLGDRFYPDTAPTVIDDGNRVPPCGTVGCYAGFIAFLTAPAGTIIADGMLFASKADYEAGSHWSTAERWAASRLEITMSQASSLFYLNNLEQVERAVNYLADNPGASSVSIWDASGYWEGAGDGED